MLSQREAAKAWRVGRETLAAKIKSGEISLASTGLIDPAEMLRVFGEPKPRPDKATAFKASQGRRNPSETTSRPAPEPPQDQGQVALNGRLEAENEHLKAIVALHEQHIADLRQALRLLDGPKDQAPRRSLWGRLFGK